METLSSWLRTCARCAGRGSGRTWRPGPGERSPDTPGQEHAGLVVRAECPVRPRFTVLVGSRRGGQRWHAAADCTRAVPWSLMLGNTDAGRRRQCRDTRSAELEGIFFADTNFDEQMIMPGLQPLDDCFCERKFGHPGPATCAYVPFREVASPMNVEKAPVRTAQPRLTPWLDAWKRLRAPRSCGQICEVGDRAAPRAEVEASLGE
ncbi:MAG: hypothetical protein QOJ73_1780 [Streptosporangiaceae bacterium]|jgi:hypothetical protein|nr:hypothetical protein [Streptosporangiaceae bacterium]